MKNPKRILPDGSLDPAADFEDDGASFRVRRETQIRRQTQPSPKAQMMGGVFLWWKIVKVVGIMVFFYVLILTILAYFNIIR